MKATDLHTPLLESYLAMQRISLSAAESLAALNADAVRVLAQQAAAAKTIPQADALVPWVLHEAAKLPPAVSESLRLSRRAAAICAATTADWLGVCAKHTTELNNQAFDAAGTLGGLLGQDAGGLGAEAKRVRERLDSAHRAYQNMLNAFREASEAFAEESTSAIARADKRTRA